MGEQNLTLNPSVPFDEKILKILEYVLPYTDTIMVVFVRGILKRTCNYP